MAYLIALINGLSYGLLLFLLAAGLSLAFGVGRILNLAHGGFYLLGGYLAYAVIQQMGSFWLALAVVPLIGLGVGAAVDAVLLRRFYGQRRFFDQVLVTFGLALVITGVTQEVWGRRVITVDPPAPLDRLIEVGGFRYPAYPLWLVGVGLGLAVVLRLVVRHTRWGRMIRAAAGDEDLARTLGIRPESVLRWTFMVGIALAMFGGVLGAPRIALAPGLDFTMLVFAMVAVVMGGLGRIEGSFWAALAVGLVDSFSKLFYPQFSVVFIFGVLAVVLMWKPEGLLGRMAP